MLPLSVALEKPFLSSRMQIQEVLLARTTSKENQDQTCGQSDANKGKMNSACSNKVIIRCHKNRVRVCTTAAIRRSCTQCASLKDVGLNAHTGKITSDKLHIATHLHYTEYYIFKERGMLYSSTTGACSQGT
jgi:hypothetical protein